MNGKGRITGEQDQNPVPPRFVPEYLRVAVLEVFRKRGNNRIIRVLPPGIAPIVGIHQSLSRRLLFWWRKGVLRRGRIVQQDRGVCSGLQAGRVVPVHYARAAESTTGSILPDHRILLRPVYEVRAGGVSPVHDVPGQGVRIVLVKEVPAAVVVYHSVRVVDPAGSRGVVVGGAIRLVVEIPLGAVDLPDDPVGVIERQFLAAVSLHRNAAVKIRGPVGRQRQIEPVDRIPAPQDQEGFFFAPRVDGQGKVVALDHDRFRLANNKACRQQK